MQCAVGLVTANNQCPPAKMVLPFSVTGIPSSPNNTPEYDTEVNIFCAPNGDKVRVVHVFDEAVASGVPISTTMFNITTGVPYGTSISTLVACADIDTESDGEDWCANGIDYTKFYVKTNGVPTGIVYWVNDVTNATSTTAPAGATKGKCVVPSRPLTGFTADQGGTPLGIIAGNLRAVTPNFTGASPSFDTSPVNNLRSITVTAKGVIDGINSASQVIVIAPQGKIALFNGQTVTFEVSYAPEGDLRQNYVIEATGNAYANIFGTFL